MSNNEVLTKEDREKLNLLLKHKELEFNWEDLKPIFRELLERANGIPPLNPTSFPGVKALSPTGAPQTFEDLMREVFPPPKATVKDLQFDVIFDLKKPAWIPWWLWEKGFLKSGINKFFKSYVIVTLKDKTT